VDGSNENKSLYIDRVEIRQAGKLIQSIEYSEDDAPVLVYPKNALRLEDIDCDGNKDILIALTTGVHGDTWYDLYRYQPRTKSFVKYPPFADESFKSVDCRNRTIRTYVNSGAAGCEYTAGVYRWDKGELKSVRIESQEYYPDSKSFIRRIATFPNREEEERRFIFGESGDCHRPTPKNLKPVQPVSTH
jgi:hypothetical protein